MAVAEAGRGAIGLAARLAAWPAGKRGRLHRLLFGSGPGNGRLLVLPIDQGLEHGPRDFFPNPPSADPDFAFRLALEGGFSAIACNVGLAERYYAPYAGKLPLILKLNGKTEIPPDDAAFSPLTATVEEAVRLGADAVGYTLYVGSPAQERDFRQLRYVRAEAERFGLPLVVWAYPRGAAVEAKGGRNSLYAVDYAARVALELGADVVKLNVPVPGPNPSSPPPYDRLEEGLREAIARVVRSAGRALVLFAGGERRDAEGLLELARLCLEAGAAGLIFGRNLWQRPYPEALALGQRLRALCQELGPTPDPAVPELPPQA